MKIPNGTFTWDSSGTTSCYVFVPTILVAALIATGAYLATTSVNRRDGPRTLRDPIPGFFNALQFMFNNYGFMLRAQDALRGHNLVRFRMGTRPVYLVQGPEAVGAMFSRELMQRVTNQEQMLLFAMPTLQKMNRDEVRRWRDDDSGVARAPIPGSVAALEGLPSRQRLWYTYEHIHAEYLGRPRYLRSLSAVFDKNLCRVLAAYPLGEWTTVSLQDVCRRELAGAAVEALFGPGLMRRTPDFVDRFWRFDRYAFRLIVGVPRWIDPAVHETHERFVEAIEAWLDSGLAEVNWEDEGPESKIDWEPVFGARVVRELIKWMLETNWRRQVIAATLGGLVFGLNSNSIPTIIWILMELIQDPSLLQAVRDEVATATTTDPETGARTLDSHRLASLPLLQSIWAETLRLRINFNITRDIKQPVTIGGHVLPAGAILQAPMMVSHYTEDVWGAPDHPASEFWAERHIKYVDDDHNETSSSSGKPPRKKRVFALAGSATSYFPFGGGVNICPGRQFAKLEVLSAVSHIVSSFDLEPLGWVKADGSPSERPARSDLRYCGAGAMPPDRDLKIRWRRIA